MLNPRLDDLRTLVRATLQFDPQGVINLSLANLYDWLTSVGFIEMLMIQSSTPKYTIEVARFEDVLLWIECSFDEESLALILDLLSMPTNPDLGDFPLQIAHREFGSSHTVKIHLESTVEAKDPHPIDSLCAKLDEMFNLADILEAEHQQIAQSAARLEGILVSAGYPVIWSPEVAFDLERITVLNTERRYYVDSLAQINWDRSYISFVDLGGCNVILSTAVPIVIESLTFRSVAELAQESADLVAEHRVALKSWSLLYHQAFKRDFPVYCPDDPDVGDLQLAHKFFVPIDSIAHTLNPAIEFGGITV